MLDVLGCRAPEKDQMVNNGLGPVLWKTVYRDDPAVTFKRPQMNGFQIPETEREKAQFPL